MASLTPFFLLREQMGNRTIKSPQEAEEGSDPLKRMEPSDSALEREMQSDLPIIMSHAQTFDQQWK